MNTVMRLPIVCLLAAGLFLTSGCEDGVSSETPGDGPVLPGDAGQAADTPEPGAADAPDTPPEPIELIDAELTNWQPINFGGEGEYYVEDGILNLDFGGPLTGLKYTGDLTELLGEGLENYEITLEAMRVEGTDFFLGFTFPVGQAGHVSLVLGGWGGSIAGLSSLDGMHAAENATTKYMGFKQKTWYTVRIRVTGEKIACWLDDEQIVDVTRADYSEFEVHPAVDLSKPLGLCAYETWAAYRNLRVRKLD